MIFGVTPVVLAADEGEITVWLDGEMLDFDVPPVIEEGRTLVPMRVIFEALGAKVDWQQDTYTAVAVKGDTKIEITVDNTVMYKNESEIVLDVPARLIDDRTLVPVRAVSESFNAKVDWQADSKKVIITALNEEKNTDNIGNTEPGETENILLSSEDMQKLKDEYDNSLRYGFEQSGLFDAVMADAKPAEKILSQSDEMKNLVFDTWNMNVIEYIIRIQAESNSEYILSVDMGYDDLLSMYMNIVKEAGLEAHDYFDVSYETLSDGSVMLLVTFNNTDTLLACKYIGVVSTPEQQIRYFTAETDELLPDNLLFCEVMADSRSTLGLMGLEKEFFTTMAETILNS